MAPSEAPERSTRKKAVALRYSKDERAPRVVAAGAGEIARRILELAAAHDIPVREDQPLTEILSQLEVGYEIPPETYRAVAEILAFLYRADEEWRREKLEHHPTGEPQAPETAPTAAKLPK